MRPLYFYNRYMVVKTSSSIELSNSIFHHNFSRRPIFKYVPDLNICAYVYFASSLPAKDASRNNGAQNSMVFSPTEQIEKINDKFGARNLYFIHFMILSDFVQWIIPQLDKLFKIEGNFSTVGKDLPKFSEVWL